MVDNNKEVAQVLLGVCAFVDYNYPKKFTHFPCISYFDSNHNPIDYKNGKSGMDEIETTVDVWEREDPKTGVVQEIHAQVDAAMTRAGFYRSSFSNMFENVTHIEHYTMRYKKLYEEAT